MFCCQRTSGAERLTIEVRETGCIERFHYPLSCEFRPTQGVTLATPFRLVHGAWAVLAHLSQEMPR
jgi:hypothetical protein